ncbi:MAG: cytochrome b N-terminal domain-containing protein [Balneolaceae bacterium]
MNDPSDWLKTETDPQNGNGYQQWEAFKQNVVQASAASPDSSIRGRKLLDYVDRWFRKLDGFTLRFLSETYHPFIQAGAIANVMFVVAVLTGFALLIWYNPSVHSAYDTVSAMSGKPWTAQLMRSMHRYSSDAFMLFVLFHAFKVFFAGRFTGSRWLAWITGIIGLGLIWFDGWLGYWLVWDETAALIATGTAKMLDVLPFFPEPLSVSFLTNDSFNSVLFLIVFFSHMLIPIGFGIALWLHVSRLNQPGFFTHRNFTILILLSLVVVSLIWPAGLEGPADLMASSDDIRVDYFYQLPLFLTERLQGGMLWLITLGVFAVLASIPWVLSRRERDTEPVVDPAKCNGCTQCFLDCPYNAISMFPREDEKNKKSDFIAWIDPSVCVSCGICVGSCDPVAIDYPNLSPWEIRRKLDQWIDKDIASLQGEYIAFVCGNSAGSLLTIDSETGYCKEMPGYHVCTVPCAGWVHPSLIERALKKGAAGVLVAGCESDPDFRLGADWLGNRIEGKRHPEFRKDRFETGNLLYLKMDKPEFQKFLNEAQQFRYRNKKSGRIQKKRSGLKKGMAAVLLTAFIGGSVAGLSFTRLSLPDEETLLLVSFKMTGAPVMTEEREDSQLLDHMQSQDRQRVERRADVRLRILADGVIVHDKSYRPSGLFRRGYSNALAEVPLEPGTHTLRVLLGDDLNGEEIQWREEDTHTLEFEAGTRAVLRYDELHGFRWYHDENE